MNWVGLIDCLLGAAPYLPKFCAYAPGNIGIPI
nr:MAG TPA: hypothetical protein [Caudoviricetes sp.]